MLGMSVNETIKCLCPVELRLECTEEARYSILGALSVAKGHSDPFPTSLTNLAGELRQVI